MTNHGSFSSSASQEARPVHIHYKRKQRNALRRPGASMRHCQAVKAGLWRSIIRKSLTVLKLNTSATMTEGSVLRELRTVNGMERETQRR